MNARKQLAGIVSTFFMMMTAMPFSLFAQNVDLPSYLLLDGFGVVRLIEETHQGEPIVYDVGSFGADKTSFTDIEIVGDEVYLLNVWGYVRSLKSPDWYAKVGVDLDIAVDLEAAPDSDGFYILDKFGAVHAIEGASNDWGQTPPFFGWDIARDFEITPDGKGYYLLDGYGVIHSVGEAKPLRSVYFGWDIARDIELLPDGSGCCLMDGFGDVYLITKDEPLKLTQPPNLGWDVAKDLTLVDGAASFYILDGYGTIYRWGDAPTLSGFPLRWNVAQNMEMLNREKARAFVQPPLSTDIRLLPDGQTAAVWQDEIYIHLYIDNVLDLEAFEFTVEFDPAVITPAGEVPFKTGELLEGILDRTKFVTEELSAGNLQIKSLYFGQEDQPVINGSGHLMTLLFKPVSDGTSAVEIKGFKGIDARTRGSAWRLENPELVLVEVISRSSTARIHMKPKVVDVKSTLEQIPEPIVAEVFLLDASNVHAVIFDLDFDNNDMDLLCVKEGSLMKSFGVTVPLFTDIDKANETGQLSDQGLVLLGRSSTAKGTGPVAELWFQPKDSTRGAVRLNKFEVMTKDMQRSQIPISNATVRIPRN